MGDVAADESAPAPLGLVRLERFVDEGETGGEWRLRKNLGWVGVEGVEAVVVKRRRDGGEEAEASPTGTPTPRSSVEKPPADDKETVEELSHEAVNTNIASEFSLTTTGGF